MQDITHTALPVYVIGDSHSLPYRNMLFREEWTDQWVAVRSHYISGLTAHDVFKAESGEFHPGIIQFLEYEGLIRDQRATHLSTSEIDFAIAAAARQPVRPPLLLFAVGDIDIRAVIMPMLRDSHDFVPPFETALPLLDRPLIPWDLIEARIMMLIGPMIAGLQRLNACGFNRIYVQSVVPPTRNEARIRQLHGYDCPASVRTKLVVCFNRLFQAECKRIGVTVIDLWPTLTEGGYLRSDLEIDGVHLPPRAARWFLNAMLEHAINCQWFAVNHVRYEMFYRIACGVQTMPMGVSSDDGA